VIFAAVSLNDPLILDEAEGLGEEAVLVEQFNLNPAVPILRADENGARSRA